MRRFVTLILAFTACVSANAQMLWPIAGAEAGEGIIYKPQQYLDDELIFSDLFIAAPQGTVVVAPADGIIDRLNVVFQTGISYLVGTGRGEGPHADC